MKPCDIKVGDKLRNRNGNYTVADIVSGEIKARYDSGVEFTVEASMALRIHSNIEREESSRIPKGVNKCNLNDFAWTLGVLASHGDFQADIPPNAYSSFSERYLKATGEAGLNKAKGIVLLQANANKWGSELRIYIPESITHNPKFVLPDDVEISAGFAVGTKRINKNWFWWDLVEKYNFRLGRTQDIDSIERALPENVRYNFKEGLAFKN